MNLEKLFKTQKLLMDRIVYKEQDKFAKTILALLVEAGECANEWRGFKYWSVNQIPHTRSVRTPAMMDEDKEFYNPLLDEYVDKLHLILQIGLELGVDKVIDDLIIFPVQNSSTTNQYVNIFIRIGDLYRNPSNEVWADVFNLFLGLGERLGFTWEEIEQAYFAKNKINHERQERGY